MHLIIVASDHNHADVLVVHFAFHLAAPSRPFAVHVQIYECARCVCPAETNAHVIERPRDFLRGESPLGDFVALHVGKWRFLREFRAFQTFEASDLGQTGADFVSLC